uniref:Uncharacterized protein n=1 Tax=Anguilla anguilla TaxID=7936 RepID=A0A0E9PB84_ANGAN
MIININYLNMYLNRLGGLLLIFFV